MLLPLMMNLRMLGRAVAPTDGDEKTHRKIAKQEKKRREEWAAANQRRKDEILKAWKALTEHPEPSVVAEAKEIAKPALPPQKQSKPVPLSAQTLDLAELSIFRATQLLEMYREIEEEEQILLLM